MEEEDTTIVNRRLIYEYILNNPGSHLRKISRELNMKLGTLRYHLDYLERKEIIASKKENNLKVYFINRELDIKDKNICPLLQQKRFRDIILTIILSPGPSHKEISNKLSINPSTLSKYINILEDRNIVYHKKIGREKWYYVFDEKRIMKLLLTYKKSFWDSFADNALEIYFERWNIDCLHFGL